MLPAQDLAGTGDGQDSATPLHQRLAGHGAVTISSTPALVYAPLAALSLPGVFN